MTKEEEELQKLTFKNLIDTINEKSKQIIYLENEIDQLRSLPFFPLQINKYSPLVKSTSGEVLNLVNSFHSLNDEVYELKKIKSTIQEECTRLLEENRQLKQRRQPWSVGHDGPSRPIITGPRMVMYSISQFIDGHWQSFAEEEEICKILVRALNIEHYLSLGLEQDL